MENVLMILLSVFVILLLISGYMCGKKTDEWLANNSAYFGKFMAEIWALCVYMFILGIILLIVSAISSENVLPYLIIMVISAAFCALIIITIKKKKPNNGVLKTLIIMLGVFWGNSWNKSMRLLGRLIGR